MVKHCAKSTMNIEGAKVCFSTGSNPVPATKLKHMKQLLITVGIILAMYLIWAFCLIELNPFKWDFANRFFLSMFTIGLAVIYNLFKSDC